MEHEPYWYHAKARRLFLTIHDPPWECYFCGDPIYAKGQKPWSLNVHHIDEDITNNEVENLVGAHSDCHVSYHRLGKPNDFLKQMWAKPKFRERMGDIAWASNKKRIGSTYKRRVA